MKPLIETIKNFTLLMAFACFSILICSSISTQSKDDLIVIVGNIVSANVIKTNLRYGPPAKSLQIFIEGYSKPIRTPENDNKYEIVLAHAKPGVNATIIGSDSEPFKSNAIFTLYELEIDGIKYISYEETIKEKGLSVGQLILVFLLLTITGFAFLKNISQIVRNQLNKKIKPDE